MWTRLAPVLAFTCAAAAAEAQEAVTYPFDGSFEDAAFLLETAIVNRGLVIDYTSHVGAMLNRTAEDLDAEEMIYDNAQIFLFCSAAISRRVMAADPLNIVHCPYGIFVMERDGEVTLGHRDYPDGPMQEVEALLDSIILEVNAP